MEETGSTSDRAGRGPERSLESQTGLVCRARSLGAAHLGNADPLDKWDVVMNVLLVLLPHARRARSYVPPWAGGGGWMPLRRRQGCSRRRRAP